MEVHEINIQNIERIVGALGEISEDMIFIGGSCVQFYVDDPELLTFRATKDVDCIVNVYTRVEYYRVSDELIKRGFRNDTSQGAPIVRWLFDDLILDVIPDDATIVSYDYVPWFKEGRSHAIDRELPSGMSIKILDFSHFLATKISAIQSRSMDVYSSKDLEDIITILDGRGSILEIRESPNKVKKFIQVYFTELLNNKDFINVLPGFLAYSTSADSRAASILNKMQSVV